MKPDIHPDYHKITVKLNDGSEFETRSTYGKEGSVLQLEVDPTTHPAWNKRKGGFINTKVGTVAKFRKRFGSISFDNLGGGAKEASSPKEESAVKEESVAKDESGSK